MPFQSVARKFSFWSKHTVHTQFCSLNVKRADHFGDVFINRRMLPSSHGGGPGSRPGKSMRDLWWTKSHWERFFSEFFGFPLSVYHSTVALQTHIIWGMYNMLT
jgi:hypothetical protein